MYLCQNQRLLSISSQLWVCLIIYPEYSFQMLAIRNTSMIKHSRLLEHCPDLLDIPWTPHPPFWGSPGSSLSCSCGLGPLPWWTSGAPPPQGCSPAPGEKKIICIQITIRKLIYRHNTPPPQQWSSSSGDETNDIIFWLITNTGTCIQTISLPPPSQILLTIILYIRVYVSVR